MMNEVQPPSSDRALSSDGEGRARAAAREALVGKSIAGRYVLRKLIGHGGMGAVYEAEHLGLGKRVAIKFVDPEFATDERVVARFSREARAMSAIESAHIVTVFDAGTEDGRPYLVMELLRGEDLGQWLRRSRCIPLPEAMHVVAQVLKGLAKAHAAGIVHRDLKPDNVFLLKSDNDPLFAKIVDFGISKIERPREKTSPLALTGRGTVLGTPFYMSPEQAQAMPDVDARADLYSVGAILFECLTGRPPHTGETYEQIILSICMRDAPDLRAIDPTLPPEVAAFIGRALSRDRVQRYTSAERMLAALHEIAPGEKKRVPLDIPSETLMSPGMIGPSSGSIAAAQAQVGSAHIPKAIGSDTLVAGAGSLNPVAPASVHTPAAPMAAVGNRTMLDGTSGAEVVNANANAMAFAPTARNSDDPGVNAIRDARSVPFTPAAPPTGEATAVELPSKLTSQSMAVSSLSIPGVPRRKRSMTTVILTAVIATLTGIGVMLGVVKLLEKRSADPAASHTQVTSSSVATTASAPPAAVSAEPAPSGSVATASSSSSAAIAADAPPASATATASAAEAKAPTKHGTAPKKPPAKKLDISRDLP